MLRWAKHLIVNKKTLKLVIGMVRNYIVTPIERKIIERFLSSGDRLEGFRVLQHRLKKLNVEDLQMQVDLIKAFLEKIEGEK